MESDEPIIARGANKINADKVWLLTRPNSDSKRILFASDSQIELRLVQEGFTH